MPKGLKAIFIALVIINVIIIGVYFWHTKLVNPLSSEKINNSSKELIEQIIPNENGSPREYIEKDRFRTIQATFVRVSDDKLYYKNRDEGNDIVEEITVDDLILYICMPSTLSSEIELDDNNTGYRDFLSPKRFEHSLV